MNIILKITVAALSVILFTNGCARRQAIVRDTFLLKAQRTETPASQISQNILAVQPFSIAPQYAGKGIVSRIGQNQYKSDYYNQYFISPASMITEQTRNWLAESGLFAQVLSPVSSIEPSHILEGHIRKLALDVRDSDAPQAELGITFFLLQQQSRTTAIEFQKTYNIAQPMKDASFQHYMAAQSRCLSEILKMLETDLTSLP